MAKPTNLCVVLLDGAGVTTMMVTDHPHLFDLLRAALEELSAPGDQFARLGLA